MDRRSLVLTLLAFASLTIVVVVGSTVVRDANVVDAPCQLPRGPEHRGDLEVEDSWIGVPAGRNGRCLAKREVAAIGADDVLQVHSDSRNASEIDVVLG